MDRDLSIGLALSGGGPAGVGHIPALQGFDDFGVRPAAIAGTSVGALIGAIYATGLPADQIRTHFEQLGARPGRALLRIFCSGGLCLNRGLPAVNARRFVDAVLPECVPQTFAELGIDLTIIAADFHAKRTVAIRDGDLRQAIAASIAIPSVFRAVQRDGRYFVDGGAYENLPVTHLPKTDFTVAVNVFPNDRLTDISRPGQIQAGLETLRAVIGQSSERALAKRPPDLYIETPRQVAGPLALWKLSKMIEKADPCRTDMRVGLSGLPIFETRAASR